MNQKPVTAYITHPYCLLHDMGAHHPESPLRLEAITQRLETANLLTRLKCYEAPPASDVELSRVHPLNHIHFIQNTSPQSGLRQIDMDTALNPHTLDAARYAAGAAILATDLVITRQVQRAFCAVRPPGHHAESARSMGFCIFNTIAVGVAHALSRHNLQRVAILDFDVHHGNGTEEIFGNNPHILFCSTFQHPFYPHSGTEQLHPNCINIPLPAGSASNVFQRAVMDNWLPAIETFNPEIIYISAGFDAHREDNMAHLMFDDMDYTWITRKIVEWAEKYSQGRIVSVLEGGYALNALGRSVALHIETLCD